MADTTAIQAMFDAVTARFTADSTEAPNRFGFREQDKQVRDGAHRAVIWVPGDDKGKLEPDISDAGTVGPPAQIGELPRAIATLDELCTVYCWAQDVLDRENELAQYTEARFLWDAWFRAMYLDFHGAFTVQRVQWVSRARLRFAGLALRTVFSAGSKVLDKPLGSDYSIDLGPTGDAAGFNIDAELNGQHQTIIKIPV